MSWYPHQNEAMQRFQPALRQSASHYLPVYRVCSGKRQRPLEFFGYRVAGHAGPGIATFSLPSGVTWLPNVSSGLNGSLLVIAVVQAPTISYFNTFPPVWKAKTP